MTPTKPIDEAELRKLRAAVYGECTDRNWQEVRAQWAQPNATKWLQEHAAKPLPDRRSK